ncbi:hypothetical protein [Dongshaea marina]|uniref:hypothetical protein n=1 Tax=Dongshaea marina TaxID=2047966 RepID=UPI00131F2DD1|nr:hypothetical protein [Dongshaea marina]
MSLALSVLLLVFVGIALRQLLPFPVQIWQIMTVGALVALASGQISPQMPGGQSIGRSSLFCSACLYSARPLKAVAISVS